MTIGNTWTEREVTHKRAVADFFSCNTRYREQIYEAGEGKDRFVHEAMKKRKTTVIDLVDRYAGGRALNILDIGCGESALLSTGMIISICLPTGTLRAFSVLSTTRRRGLNQLSYTKKILWNR